ncbi:MAG: hypothetical protein CVV44_04685 [Spirochaetae bacterium HGW-Spirochaetae-1]|jgi:Zn finger protein HypA/HybF involved in hydrogenase expression|nr:MAG: hypothetical protein CVV44_04685 [Spirochaetae bacterium HGW-Spirochaetae-1]
MKKKGNFENNFDDYVYDDDFYREFESDLEIQEEKEGQGDVSVPVREIIAVCEDCTNQWEDMVDVEEEKHLFCPLCGSSRVVII